MTDTQRCGAGRTLPARARRGVARLTALLLVLTAAGTALTAGATLAAATIGTPFTSVYTINTTGDIQIRGNTLMTCQAAVAACAGARNTAGGGATANAALNDNNYWMVYVDTDADPATFNSASSTVNLPAGASVLYAALVWGGRPAAGTTIGVAGVAAPTPADTNKVKLKAPGQATYADLTASSTATDGGNYQSFRDVTSIVQAGGNGSYTIANVQTGQGGDSYAGWGLAIAYSDSSAPSRNLTIFKGYGSVSNGQSFDIPVTGFTTPPAGPVRTTLGAVSYEGDLGSTGDQLLLGPTAATLTPVHDALHSLSNVFNSTISDSGVDSSTRNPNYKNQLGFDTATFDANGFLPNSATDATVRVTSSSETYYPGLITFATELYAPALNATKSVAVVAKAAGNLQSGVLEPGDTLEYTINATNNGQDAATPTVLTDTIPGGTSYVPGSLTSAGGSLTDATGDDIGSYDSGTNKVTVNLGTGATASSGGRVAVGASTSSITFRAVADASIANNQAVNNIAGFSYAGELSSTTLVGTSNAVTTPAVRHHSALAISKSADLPLVQRGAATTVTYTLTVTNNGPYDEPSATVTDTLPSGATFGTVTPSSGSCAPPAAQTVTCSLGSLVNGGTATVVVHAVLDGSADPATDTATVSGTNVDSNVSNNVATKATAVNTAPVATADSATTSGAPSASTATITVLGNDSDADADPLSVSAPTTTTPSRGNVVVNADKTVTYTAAPGQAGTDTFSYTVNDGRGGTATALVTVTIPNSPPDAIDDASSTTLGAPVTVPVLTNDTDANLVAVPGQSLAVSGVTQPAGGAGSVTTDGATVTFTPSVTFTRGTSTFTYTVSDGAGGSDTATVTITMANVDPVAAADTAGTTCVAAVDVDVLVNDSDPNADPLTVTAVTGASHGIATIVGTGTSTRIHYVPNAAWSGADVLQYTLSDGTSTASGQLTVTTASCAPVVSSFSQTVNGATTTSIDLLAHTSDPDSAGHLTVTGTAGATHGSLSAGPAGTVLYTPSSTYVGTETFTYTVSDPEGNIASATVTLTVLNQVPVAHADATPVPANGSVNITVLGNDTDGNGDTLHVSGVSVPAHGTATLHPDETVTYTPDFNYLGTDTFTYAISDGRGGTDTATVTITVANQPPVAVDDTVSFTGVAGAPITIDALTNDSDPNGDPLTLDGVATPLHGTAVVHSGNVVYTPDPTYAGLDTFTYAVKDGRGGQSVATVVIDIHNRAPHAMPDSFTAPTGMPTIVDALANDEDPDSEVLSVSSVQATSAHGGTVSVTSGGRLRYVSADGFTGLDTFTYVVADRRGGTDIATVTVMVSNAPPVATNVAVSTSSGHAVGVRLLDAAADPDGQPLHIVSAGPALHGAVSLDATGRTTYTPVPGFVGDDSYNYVVSDGQGGYASATVTVTVDNAAPAAADDVTTTPRGKAVVVAILDNDSDPNTPFVDQNLRVTRVKVTSGKATASITADGRLRVVPNGNYTGVIVVTYTISDADGARSTAELRITVVSAAAAHQLDRLTHDGDQSETPAIVRPEASALPHTGANIVPVGVLGITLIMLGALACLFATGRREET